MNLDLPRVYLVRHGGTAWTLTGQHTGSSDLPLTEQGELQAHQLKASLADDANESSSGDGDLAAPGSRVHILVIRTRERPKGSYGVPRFSGGDPDGGGFGHPDRAP